MTLAGNTAGTTTFNASNNNTLFFNGGNNITLSGNGSTVTISGPTLTNSSWTVSDTATSATVGRLAFTNANGVTMTLSTSNNGNHTVFASHNGITSQSTQFLAMTLGGNTAGTTTFHATNNASLFFNGGNNITLSGNGSTVTISAAAQTNQTGNLYVSANSTQLSSTAAVDLRTLSFAGAGGVSMGVSQGVVLVSAPATSSLVGADGISVSSNGSTISVRLVTMNAYEPLPLLNADSTTYAPAAGTWYIQPLMIPFPISGGRWNIMVAHGSTASNFQPTSSASYSSNTTGTLSITGSYERRIAFYSIGAAGNSTRLESVTSANWPLSFTHIVRVASAAGPLLTVSITAQISGITSINSAGATTQSTFSTASAVNTASGGMNTTALSSLQSKMNDWISSQMLIPIPFNTSLTAGQYYVGFMWNSASGSTSTGALLGSNINTISVVNQYALFGNTNTGARLALVQTAASSGSAPFPGVGFYSVSSAAPPATMAFSDIRTTASQPLNYINYVNQTF
jgi:hypothetical protein